jgi:hypothetical protein
MSEGKCSSFEASQVEGKMGTVRTQLKMRFESAYAEMNRLSIASPLSYPFTKNGGWQPKDVSRNI